MENGSERRGKVDLGAVLIGLGVLGILWGVLHLLGHMHGAEGPPRTFSERTSYNEAKRNVHGALPGALLRALPGLGLAFAGACLRRRHVPR